MNGRAPRVNLLPAEVGRRQRERRWLAWTGVAVLVLVLVLAGTYLAKLRAVDAAERDQAAAAAQVAELGAEVASLQDFAALDRRLEGRNALLAAAMATEISWARVLNDLSLTFPANSSLLTLVAARTQQERVLPTGEPEPEPDPADVGEEAVAEFAFTGYSVERFAPGVESVLLRVDEVRAFFNAYLSQAATAQRASTEVTTFNGTVQLDDDAYTGRYDDGLPALERR